MCCAVANRDIKCGYSIPHELYIRILDTRREIHHLVSKSGSQFTSFSLLASGIWNLCVKKFRIRSPIAPAITNESRDKQAISGCIEVEALDTRENAAQSRRNCRLFVLSDQTLWS